MGLIKKLMGSLKRATQDPNYQWKAVLKVEKIAGGEKVLAPEYLRDAERKQKAMQDPKIKEEIEKKHDELIDNINEKIKITSTDPSERWVKAKDFPSRESEFLHRNDASWEYGFYEPPIQKMEKDRLMLREAIEILRLRESTEGELAKTTSPEVQEKNFLAYDEHPAVKRVDELKLELLWKFYRPFIKQTEEKVASKEDYEKLLDYAIGMGTEEEYFKRVGDQRNLNFELRRLRSLFPQTTKEDEEKLKDETEKVNKFIGLEMRRLENRAKKLKELESERIEENKKILKT